MKLGVFGSPDDAQCKAFMEILRRKGVETVLVDSQSLNRGEDCAFVDGRFYYRGQCLDEVGAWYMRYVMSPLSPAFEAEDQYYLYTDWFVDYMHRQERSGYQLAWLLALSLRGVPVVNSPEHGSVVQLKMFQLAVAQQIGLPVPKTLITNNPARVRQFCAETPEVVYKPLMGGALCQPLDQAAQARLDDLVTAPAIFQERVVGTGVRVTVVGEKIVSAVRIPSETLDYRADLTYKAGKQVYYPIVIDTAIANQCLGLMRACGLLFSGIDLVLKPDGSYVFLEANSSPVYYDIEQKTRAPITRVLAEYLLKLANDPAGYRQRLAEAARTQNFIAYAHPFRADLSITERLVSQNEETPHGAD